MFKTSVYKVYQFRSIIFIFIMIFFLLHCLLCGGKEKKFILYEKSGKLDMIRDTKNIFSPFLSLTYVALKE